MKRRSNNISDEFGIMEEIERFSKPPCKMIQGKDVLSRVYSIYRSEATDFSEAAWKVSAELINFYKIVDSNIPVLSIPSIHKKIMKIVDDFKTVKKKSWKEKPCYKAKVRKF